MYIFYSAINESNLHKMTIRKFAVTDCNMHTLSTFLLINSLLKT